MIVDMHKVCCMTNSARLRLTRIVAAVACTVVICAGSSFADLSMLEGTTKATSNSVWNFAVRWQDSDGLWPVYMPDSDTDYNLQPDPMPTFDNTGQVLGLRTVRTAVAPLPRAYVWYRVPALNSLDGTIKIKFNKGILTLDPNRTNPNGADPRDPSRPGSDNPILGVYASQADESADNPNLFDPLKYSDAGRYGVITIDPDKLPARLINPQTGRMDDWTPLYIKVSTCAIDGVYTREVGTQESSNRQTRRVNPYMSSVQPINYAKQPEWMPGVITGTWQGPGTGRPPSPADSQAYTVTPTFDPTASDMRAVTGIYLPQLMNGVVYDSTHVVPADPSKVKMVLGVFALSNQTGTRYDDTHVNPSNPSVITFVSAVYAIHTMNGTPVDSTHVSPENPSNIRRVLSVKIPGQNVEYYDATQHPWMPGDTIIALKDGMELPEGTQSVVITYETVNLYDPEDPSLAYKYDPSNELTRYIALSTPLPEGANTVRIVYGVGTGLDGFNYYDPQNANTAYVFGDEQITLRYALPSDVTDVRILYGTDEQLETRGSIADPTHVVPPNIWRVGRVSGVYAIQEQDGIAQAGTVTTQTGTWDTSDPTRMTIIPSQPELIAKVLRVYDSLNRDYYGPTNPANPFKPGDKVIKLDKPLPAGVNMVTISYQGPSTTIIPSDSTVIKGILGVYAVREMSATVVDSTHIIPEKPLSIRSVRAVYVTANQAGTVDNTDAKRLTVIPSTPGIIGRVFGVYDNPSMTGTNYFDPDNPETVFRPGDTTIKLSTPLPAGVSSVTINYETINLGPSYAQGSNEITLARPIPNSVPAISPVPIRVVYVNNLNYAVPNTQSATINLRTPLPLGTTDVVILYIDRTNRYGTTPAGSIPRYAPGEDSIEVATAFPTDALGGHIEYTAHLFAPSYDPFDYNPSNPSTYLYRPFIPGDKVIRLNRIDPTVPLWSKYTSPGALKLCIAYQSSKRMPIGDYSQSGIISLPIPLPEKTQPIQNVFVDYRVLSSVGIPNPDPNADPPYINATNEPPKEGLIILATYTVGIPYMGKVERLSFYEPDPVPHPLPQISATGKFTFPSPLNVASIWVQYRRQEPDTVPGASGRRYGVVWANIGSTYRNRAPMYIDPTGGYDPIAGVTYRVAVSRGLNLSNVKQQPSCNLEENYPQYTNRLIFDPRQNPMWYASALRANGDGTPRTFDVSFTGIAYKDNWVVYSATQTVTVHDSRPRISDEMIDHGGIAGNRDYLTSYPRGGDPDPLVPEPAVEINPTFPDDGSSSTQFVFRVRYENDDGLPPQPWLPLAADPWLSSCGPTGVVLYLDEQGTGDYKPHFMAPEDPNKPGAGNVYIYRVLPHHTFGWSGPSEPVGYPWNWANRTYESLACGVYQYFFACSDDSLTFDDGSFVFNNQRSPIEWGEAPSSYSTGLDPSLPRQVTDFPEVSRPANRRPSDKLDRAIPYDSTLYVDRYVLVPGQFHYRGYPLSASEHPVVTCELRMPPADDLNIPYDDAKYGYGRFFGTIYPYSRATNPLIKGGGGGVNDPVYHGHLALAETCGATTKTENVFRILYKQKDNKPPVYIKLFINNASYKSGSGANYQYTAYTMYPRPGQPQPYNYRTGVWYEYKTKLPPGPHTYYFEAYDGYHVVRFPVRPDKYPYDDAGADQNAWGYYVDGWVPTTSLPSERGSADYFDNDYFPGPYVNNPCVLSEASVTPSTGKEGQNFRYRIKYTDPDGQRPYSAYIYIEVNNRGEVRRFSMVPETPFLDPTADHSNEYKNGVYYILDTATIKDLMLENGVRRFYFEFTDDWGAYYDLNDRIQGETTRYPEAAGSWITGPVISGNQAPTLTKGSVTSQDGTANPATLWTFRVTYRDLDNDPPAVIKLYLGELQPDGRTVLWDEGHAMLKADPGDNVYSDGADYYYQTRLGTSASAALSEQKQYFYAFVAYDGVDYATYNSSSNDELRSDAANCMLFDPLVRVDSSTYKIRPLVVQQATVVTTSSVKPDNPSDILRVWGVYLTEDVDKASGAASTNYYEPGTEPGEFSGDTIVLTRTLPAGTTKVWVKYEPRAPIVGPLPIDLPAPAGVIPDAQIYVNYPNNPSPVLIDDQKNGWVNDDPNQPEDRSVLVMKGLAVYQGQPSVKYVTPDSPRDIASVEGVYLTPDLSGENYYDPKVLETPMVMGGSVDPTDATRKTVIPDDPDRILYVTGVFDPNDPNSTPVNYFMGAGYPDSTRVAWQEALIVGTNTVWPKNPNDIVSIQGIYQSPDVSKTNYYRQDRICAQLAYAFSYLAKPSNPQSISQVLGIYLTQSESGTNYYNRFAAPVPYYYNLTYDFPGGTSTVHILYKDSSGATAWQPATVWVGSLRPADYQPISKVLGAYLLPSDGKVPYDANGKPVAQGLNYAPNSSYKPGDLALRITPVQVSSTGAPPSMYIIFESLPFGFGPYGEYLASSRDLTDLMTGASTVYVAYYPRAGLTTISNKTFVPLTSALPAGVDRVNIRCIMKSFNAGDSVIPLTKDLPEGTDTVYIKYADIRFTHQGRGEAQQPISLLGTLTWSSGTSHYAPDGWNVASSEKLWMRGTPVDPITVIPEDTSVIESVNGVFLAQDVTGFDYYAATPSAYISGDRTITLGTPIPAGTTQVWINYSPRSVYIKNNLDDVTSGVVGVWLNNKRDGENYFNPRLGARHPDNPDHLRLTQSVPDGTTYLWARYYQKGEYHIDRWNRKVVFLPGYEKDASAVVTASYFFGTRMPQTLSANTPPTLTQGKVNKLRGSRSDTYVFSVTYRDLDGPNGQAPAYVRVYIDGVPYDMTPTVQGTPPYREGAVYTYTPTDGLSGGSHKFHFEASDGADIAIYDWYTENNVPRPSTGQTIRDLDGPWVNNPPELSDGIVTPNPTGGINPWDSVDYYVTYTDVDNDEPYFYDPARDVYDYDADKSGVPDGIEWSGSPRLWVDSGVKDVVVTGTVESLEDDPMAPGKKRTIVVAGNPGWQTDRFAGQLMQITNGAIAGRVYLIQSNTENKLFIATEDLAADGVKGSNDPEPSQFRINGLLMSKADPTQQDYTKGVRYKITVPKLAVGTHKFHFTAMSRENKPQWLIQKLEAKDRVPYSVKVQYPASGDENGPIVVSTPPAGNTAPTINNTQDSSIYLGPVAQLAVATALDTVEALDAARFATIREVRGVFMNANDFSLTSLTDDPAKNYYDPLTATAFKPGDTAIKLTRNLPAVPNAEMVQFGTVDAVTLTSVTPDAANVIDTVLGVYLTSDPTLAGINYYGSTGSFDGNTIKLAQPLPSGTKTVFVRCTLKPGLTWTSNPPVPVYVKHFATTGKTVFQASDLLTFRINYRDADGDPPSYHDGVQGYVKVVFNNLNQSRSMRLLNWSGGAVDYTKDQVFTTDPINPPEGTYKYHFEASDGYYVSRWPQGTLGDPAANDYPIRVNYKPVLSNGKVEPTAGQSATNFTFTVTYKDQDGPGATQPQVYARIIRADGTRGYVRLPMRMKTGTPNYSTGVEFDLVVVPNKLSPALEPGQYKVVFEATDGDGEDAVPLPQPSEDQIYFTIRDTNAPPVLSDPKVEPAAGKLNTTFVYSVLYKDADGDAPISKLTGAKDVITVTIDKGKASQQVISLTKSASAPTNPTPNDYKNGVRYDNKTQPISGKKLGAGQHTFEVSASDGTADAVPVSAVGPVLLIPYFDQFRAVDATATDPDNAPALRSANVGQEVVFVGNMKFPDNPVAQPPAQISNLSIVVTKPDGTSVTLSGSATDVKEEIQSGKRVGWTAKIRASYPKGVDTSLVTGTSLSLNATGEWTVGISWPGDAVWDKADNIGKEFVITVGGPMRTIAVADPAYPDESTPLVDMITVPKIIGSPDPGRIFGYERALQMQIVRWDPTSMTYFRYGTQGLFPDLLPGHAIWIKPAATYPAENISLTDVENGLIALGNPEAPVNERKKYRLIKPFVKDYPVDASGNMLPCTISLKAGWNQFGNIFFNWKKDATGKIVSPRQDVGIPIAELSVRYLGQTKSLADAAKAGWIRDYAWRYDAVRRQYVLVHATAAGAETVLKAWSGYWIRAFVDCELIINPNTSYNGPAANIARGERGSGQMVRISATGTLDSQEAELLAVS
ncbi:MAG: hypothetical protein QHI38_08825, partial [Armatimonadota bacterium]|nr:hypothetical protein [Armatimonadota bacterium]